MLKLIKQWINKLKAIDPVYSCPVYMKLSRNPLPLGRG